MPLQVAILAGDFLLARASVTLAALRDSEVIQLLSQVIEDLVTGEILQVRLQDKGHPGLLHSCQCVQVICSAPDELHCNSFFHSILRASRFLQTRGRARTRGTMR